MTFDYQLFDYSQSNFGSFGYGYSAGHGYGWSNFDYGYGPVFSYGDYSGGLNYYSNPFSTDNYYYPYSGSNLIFDYGSSYSYQYDNDDSDSFEFYGYHGSVKKLEEPEKESPVSKKSDKTTDKKPEKAKPKQPKKFEKVSPQVTAQFVQNAQKYLGYNEQDKSFHKFSYSTEWCGDFVSGIIKETFGQNGIELPEGIVNHRVVKLKEWAIDQNVFTSTFDKEDKASFIAQNIKPGDIMILNQNGDSHIGFVVEVRPDGSFKAIEGNRYDKVDYGEYKADYEGLSGFAQLS